MVSSHTQHIFLKNYFEHFFGNISDTSSNNRLWQRRSVKRKDVTGLSCERLAVVHPDTALKLPEGIVAELAEVRTHDRARVVHGELQLVKLKLAAVDRHNALPLPRLLLNKLKSLGVFCRHLSLEDSDFLGGRRAHNTVECLASGRLLLRVGLSLASEHAQVNSLWGEEGVLKSVGGGVVFLP